MEGSEKRLINVTVTQECLLQILKDAGVVSDDQHIEHFHMVTFGSQGEVVITLVGE